MKTSPFKLLQLALGATLMAAPALSHAQTSLAAGGISFTGYDSRGGATGSGSEWFSFVLNRSVDSGTVINFTDIGYIGAGQNTNPNTFTSASAGAEGALSWTANTGLPTGTEITINNFQAYRNGSTTTTTGTVAAIPGSGTFNLSSTDQVIAYQGTLSPSATFLAAIHWNRCSSGGVIVTTATGWDPINTCTGVSASQVPPGLTSNSTNGNAIWIGDVGTNVTLATYNCSNNPTPHSPTNFRTSVTNFNNWIRTTGGSTAAAPTGSACGRTYYATILPVSWLSLQAGYKDDQISLEWTVGNEEALRGYDVERSENGQDFEAIGTVVAKGGTGTLAYQFADRNVGTAPQYFYRLRTIAIDGNPQHSAVARVANRASTTAGFRLLRNPVGNTVELEAAAAADGSARLVVTDLAGRVVLQQEWPVSAGRQVLSCPAGDLLPGQMYLLSGYLDGKVWRARVIR